MNLSYYNQSAKLLVEDATKLINLNRELAKLSRSNSHYNALSLFQQIHSSGTLKPDHYSLSSALTSSAKLPDLRFGNQLHAHAIYTGFKTYPHVSNPLLSLYANSQDLGSVKHVFYEMGIPDIYSWTTLLSACAKLGQVFYACQLLDEMPLRNVAPWNSVITGCSENGYHEVGFDLFRRMHVLGLSPDNYTYAGVLGSCSNGFDGFGRQVHSLIVKSGFLDRTTVTNSLLSMYFNCGNVTDACRIFEESGEMVRDEISYNAMINGLVSLGRDAEALMIFKGMLDDCLRPTDLTFLSLMSAGLDPIACFQLHAQAIKVGYGSCCTTVSNAAMSMYADRRQLDATRKVFHQLEYKDIVSWNTLLAAYAHNDCAKSAMLCFMEMWRKGIVPDEYTIGTLLSDTESSEIIQMLYALVVKTGLSLISEAMNALVSAFSKQGDIDLAYQIFSDLDYKNLITWNATISGFFMNARPLEALRLFLWMQKSEVRPDVYSLTSVLSICASISSLKHGKQIHGYILRHCLSTETSLGNGLITMYAKCGVLDLSAKVFDSINNRDVVTWNAVISACAQCGEGKKAVEYFKAIPYEIGMKPDQATFTAVLSACSHAGLVSDGLQIFNSMVNDYGFKPGVNHFSCLVDLLGRAGYLDEAEELIEDRGLKIDSNVLWTLFSACAAYGNVRLGRIVAGLLLQTEKNDPSVYVLLSNIHANAGQWEDAAHVRELITRVGVAKQPGCSWISSAVGSSLENGEW